MKTTATKKATRYLKKAAVRYKPERSVRRTTRNQA